LLYDLLALGSWVFYLIVIIRALIGPFRPFIDQLLIAGACLLLLQWWVREQEHYLARGIVLAFFTSMFYQDFLFTGFASLIVLGMMVSSYALHRSMKNIFLGLFVGIVSILAGWFLT
jgi:hypothetical protein